MRITVHPLKGLLVRLLWLERKLHSRGKGERCSINSAVSISDVGVHWSEGKFGLVGGGGGRRKGEGGEGRGRERKEEEGGGRGRRPGRRMREEDGGGRRGKVRYTYCFVSIAIAMDTTIAMDIVITMDTTIAMDTAIAMDTTMDTQD